MEKENNAQRIGDSGDRDRLPAAISQRDTASQLTVDQISDPKKRDEVLVYTQKVIITVAAIYAIGGFLAHWHSAMSGYPWKIQEWELAIMLSPFGGATLYSWLKNKIKIPGR